MSTTADSTTQRARRALRHFDDLLYASPEICSRCYARIRDRTEHDQDLARLGTGNRPAETLERAGAGTVGQDADDVDGYGYRPQYRARTYCGACGSPGGTDIGGWTRSLQQMRRHTDNVIRRLHERGYYPDVQAVYRAVERLKTQPEHQQRDRQIFAAAVAVGLRRGREAPEGSGRPRVSAFRLAWSRHGFHRDDPAPMTPGD